VILSRPVRKQTHQTLAATNRRLSVLHTALEADGALSEIYFHVSRGQPIFPSRIRHELCELSAKTERTLILAGMDDLVSLGVEKEKYHQILYKRTQDIAATAAFMGFDGIIAPGTRYVCNNLVLFLDNYNLEDIEVASKLPVDWTEWRTENIGSR
jgi:hypothetical protein